MPQAFMDSTIPYGEAHTPNGGLKEAHEIEWVFDPDDDTPVIPDCKSVVNQRCILFLTLIRQELTALPDEYPNHFESFWNCFTGSESCR
jgi:hypothetical protein